LIVTHRNVTADFWPGTGKFILRIEAIRAKDRFGTGVFNLIRRLGVTVNE
jgi:hypothetical protein